MADHNKFIGLDGIQRPLSDEQKLNKVFASLFTTPAGQEVLKYLRSVTIELVSGPAISDEELRHREGQRYLVGLIESRVNKGKKNEHPT